MQKQDEKTSCIHQCAMEASAQKKKTYREYTQAKKEMQKVLTAKANADQLLSSYVSYNFSSSKNIKIVALLFLTQINK